ncbi:MAG: hypothetical protein MJ207_02270 [Bacilli bacterium]|nr:hypothetical protein [Bacilli bacterium]
MKYNYSYLNVSAVRLKLINYFDNVILKTQNIVRCQFTFSFNLVGSAKRNLITVDSNGHIDLDYNLMIQKDKIGITNDAKKFKLTIMNAFRECLPKDTHVCDSTSAITIKSNNFKINGYRYSADFAIMFDDEKNHKWYKLYYDKPNNAYIWGRIPKSKNFQERFTKLKRMGYWVEIKELYLIKKNRSKDKDSFSLLLETVNELEQKYGLR